MFLQNRVAFYRNVHYSFSPINEEKLFPVGFDMSSENQTEEELGTLHVNLRPCFHADDTIWNKVYVCGALKKKRSILFQILTKDIP